MAQVLQYLPELAGEELRYIANIFDKMTDERAQEFANVYKARRRDPMLVLVCALGGLLMIPGLQRFILNQIGMGILYLFTIGLCFVGSIVDLVNYQKLTFDYNVLVAEEVLQLIGNKIPEKSE